MSSTRRKQGSPPTPVRTLQTNAEDAIASLEDSFPDSILAAAAEARRLPRIAGYEIIRELGRGGMGVVYLAKQETLNRLVALKMMRAGCFADTDALQRFQREGEAIARLQHPNIVQVYELGSTTLETEGVLPYMALEYIDGVSLDQLVSGKPLPARTAAQLLLPLAEAVHTAHEKGILHRDLKPANILLGAVTSSRAEIRIGTWEEAVHTSADLCTVMSPKITDFGLAKLEVVGLTTDSMVLGTPNYLAPEQSMSGQEVGPAADVYGLGAILYECLTGRPPFPGQQALEIIRQVQQSDPATPSSLGMEVPQDAETICLKCLQKDPHRRYASAADLAEDLRRFLAGQPILARPVSTPERWFRWCRRNPLIAGLAAASILIFLLGFALVSWQAFVASNQWERAEQREQQAAQARRIAQHESARAALDLSIALCEKGDLDQGLLELSRALGLILQTGDPALERVARLNLTTWHRQFFRPRAALPHQGWIWAVAFSPDQRMVLTGSFDGTVQRWETATGKPLGPPLRHPSPVWAVTFSPDGKSILSGCGEQGKPEGGYSLWDAATGVPRGPLHRHLGAVNTVAFTPDSRTFLIGSQAEIVLGATATGLPHGTPLRHGEPPVPIHQVCLSPNGKFVATVGADDSIRLWDAATRQPRGMPLPHLACRVAAFSPDSKTLISGSVEPATLQAWQVETGQPLGPAMPQVGPVKTLAYSPDGQLLGVSCTIREPGLPKSSTATQLSGEVRLWQTHPLLPRSAGIRFPAPIWSLAFSPDSQLLLLGGEDGRARCCHVADLSFRGQSMLQNGNVVTVAFNRDGTLALLGDAGGGAPAARLWEIRAPLTPGPTFRHHSDILCFAFHPLGHVLLSGTEAGIVRRWNIASAQVLGTPLHRPGPVMNVGYSQDGQVFLTRDRSDGVRLWDHDASRAVFRLDAHADKLVEAVLSPDGREILLATMHGYVYLQNRHTQQGRAVFDGGPLVGMTGFSPNGALVVTTFRDGRVFLSRRSTGSILHTLHHRSPVPAAAFSPDSRILATGTDEGVVQLWDTAAGRPLGSPMLHPAGIHSLAFSPDGQTLVVGTVGHSARLWDVTTTRPISPLLPQGGRVLVAFHPSGKHFATTRFDHTIQMWEMPTPLPGTAAQVRLWIQVLTGMALDAQGAVQPLSPEALTKLRKQLQQQNVPELMP